MDNNENNENISADEIEVENVSNEENVATEPEAVENCDNNASDCDARNKIVSTPAFLGYMILFGIPIIGFIACIIMSFAPKRKNLKNYARATLIKSCIGMCIFVGICVSIINFISPIVNEISHATEGVVNTFGEIMEYIDEIDEEEFSEYFELIEKYENGEIDVELDAIDKVIEKAEGIKKNNKDEGKIPIVDVPNGNVSKDVEASVVIGE